MVSSYDEQNDGNGRIILWITFGLMAASAVGFAALGATKPMKLRAHAFVSVGICSIAAAAYYALATNSGKTPVLTGDGVSGVSRDVFYARYIDWVFTTPLLLLDVLLIAGAPFGTTLWIMFCDVMMIVLGLFGAITVGKFKWGWFGIACAFQLIITYGLLVPGVQAARLRSSSLTKSYLAFTLFLCVLWLGYPIVWGLAEGANVITSQAEAGSYAGLDIAAKVLFGWAIMLGLSPLHHVQLDEEKRNPYYVQPLTTPINDVWGTHGATGAPHSHTPSAAHRGEEGEYTSLEGPTEVAEP